MTWHSPAASLMFMIALASSLGAQTTELDEGLKLFREAQFDQALVKFEAAQRMAPRNATIENLLGITETRLGQSTKPAIIIAMRFALIL